MESKVYYTLEGDMITSYPELDVLLIEDEMKTWFVDAQKIKMVGSYMFSDGSLWYSYPKYFQQSFKNEPPSETDQLKMKTIIQVIEKLRCNGKNLFEGDHIFSPDTRNESKRKVNIIELATYIVRDYMSHGIYYRENREYARDRSGKIAWTKTISKSTPLIDNDAIIYDELWIKSSRLNVENEISKVHAYIAAEAIKIYERYNGYTGIVKPVIDDISKEDLPQYTKLLKQELLYIFADRDISLLKALIAWCEETIDYRMAGCTNCFQNVWEWVNDAVFGNQTEKESQYPIYTLYDSEKKENRYFGRGTAKPDTIYFRKNKDNDRFRLYVYDAKYYLPKPIGQDIFEYPTNSDIVKQVAYMQGLSYSLRKLKVDLDTKNIFLLPEISERTMSKLGQKKGKNILYSEIGYVKKASFDVVAKTLVGDINIEIEEKLNPDDEEKVYLYMVYCEKLFEMYLANKKFVPIMEE